jgi:hypothetical protein
MELKYFVFIIAVRTLPGERRSAMPDERFQALFTGICQQLGAERPMSAPEPDAHGLLAFHLLLDGTPVNVFQRPGLDDDSLFVVVELGTLPPDVELRALRQLMEANFALLGRQAPCFARHPASGHALLQWACPLATTTAAGLHAALVRAAGLARDWIALAREGLAPTPAPAPAIAGFV